MHTAELATPADDLEKDVGERRNVLKVSVGELEADIQQSERAIADLSLSSGMDLEGRSIE